MMAGFGLSVRASSQASSTCRCSSRAVLGAEGNDDALRLRAFGFRVGVQPARSGQRLDAGEVNVMSALAAQPGLQQFVAPFGVAQRRDRCERWKHQW